MKTLPWTIYIYTFFSFASLTNERGRHKDGGPTKITQHSNQRGGVYHSLPIKNDLPTHKTVAHTIYGCVSLAVQNINDTQQCPFCKLLELLAGTQNSRRNAKMATHRCCHHHENFSLFQLSIKSPRKPEFNCQYPPPVALEVTNPVEHIHIH